MYRLDKDYNLMNIYNLDLYDSSNFTLSNIKNRNIFNFLLYISKKDNLDHNNNNIPNNNENDYKRFKEKKKKIYEILSNTDAITKSNNNKLLMDFYIHMAYNKLYALSEEGITNSKIDNKKYNNALITLIYLDYIQNDIFNSIKSIVSDNNNGKKSTINIKIKEEKVTTINILPNPLNVFECPKCERSYTLEQNSFYFCLQCQEKSFFCEECYTGFNLTINNKKKTQEQTKSKDKNIFHDHHLIMFYKYSQNKTSFIIKAKYEKFLKLISDKKSMKNYKVKCDICNMDENFKKSKIVISHFKKIKIKDEFNNDYNIKDIEDIYICHKCFKSNIFSNIINEEYTTNNIIIF
jgi:hypothetical protein